jgi:hypothetical protein
MGKVGVRGEGWEVPMDGLSKRPVLVSDALVPADVGKVKSPQSKLASPRIARHGSLWLSARVRPGRKSRREEVESL